MGPIFHCTWAPYSTVHVALHAFSMKQVYSCGIATGIPHSSSLPLFQSPTQESFFQDIDSLQNHGIVRMYGQVVKQSVTILPHCLHWLGWSLNVLCSHQGSNYVQKVIFFLVLYCAWGACASSASSIHSKSIHSCPYLQLSVWCQYLAVRRHAEGLQWIILITNEAHYLQELSPALTGQAYPPYTFGIPKLNGFVYSSTILEDSSRRTAFPELVQWFEVTLELTQCNCPFTVECCRHQEAERCWHLHHKGMCIIADPLCTFG